MIAFILNRQATAYLNHHDKTLVDALRARGVHVSQVC